MSVKHRKAKTSSKPESKLQQWQPVPTVLKDGVNIPHKTLAKNIGISENGNKNWHFTEVLLLCCLPHLKSTRVSQFVKN